MDKIIEQGTALHMLSLEDSVLDYEIICERLTEAGFDLNSTRVENQKEYSALLSANKYEIIIADFKLPGFDAFGALRIAREICPDVPFVCVSGSIGEELAVELLKAGAVDYILKDRLERLPFAIKRAIDDAKEKQVRKSVEEDLNENNTRLELAMQSANMAWWEMDITTGNVIFDKRKADMLGYSAEKFNHYNDFIALVHPEDSSKAMKAMQKHIDGLADKYEIEYRILTQSGEYKWFYDIGAVVKKDSNGSPLQASGFVIDITESKLAEEKVREKDFEFRKLSANAPGLIFQFTRKPDGSYVVPIASEGIKDIFGCTPEDVIDDFSPIGKVIYPEDSAKVINDIEESAKNLSPFFCEFRVQIPGKPIQWIFSRSTPEKLPDGSITWYGFNNDITESKLAEEQLIESESRLKLAMTSGQIGIWEWKLKENVLIWDDRMFELYGIKKDDSPNTFDAWANGLHPEDKLRAFDECNEALNGGKNYNTEFRVLHPDGNVLYLKADAIIIRNQNGEAIRMIGLNKDITQAKKAEKNIRKLNRVYALLSSTDQAIVRVHNRQQLLDEACRIAVEDGGFQMTWIGLLNPETNKLDVVASAGKVGDYLKNVNIDFNIAERCSGPTGQAIIHGKSVFTSNIETDDLMKPWKEAAVENAYRSSISLPLTIAGKVIGAYTMYSSEADFFDTDEVTLLDGMASDISFALEFIENEIERKLAEDELQFTLSQLRQLHNHIESLIEKEKTAISRELHDGLGQMLTAILMDISFIKNDVTNPNALLKIQSVINLIKDTIKLVQKLTAQLRPQSLDDLGLELSLEAYTNDFKSRFHIDIFLDLDTSFEIDRDVAIVIYRIILESLTNVGRHSEATQVIIKLSKIQNKIHVSIADNGRGIREEEINAKDSFGIMSMKERASAVGGTFEIGKGTERGTLTKLCFPI